MGANGAENQLIAAILLGCSQKDTSRGPHPPDIGNSSLQHRESSTANKQFDKEEIDRRDRLLDGLSKIYPICSYCKKVREKSGKWVSVEKYVMDVSGTVPSHGICPHCYETKIKRLE